MERQKIFWVVLSVSVFVVIVLVVGVLLLRQHPAAAATTPTVSSLPTQVYEYQKEPTGVSSSNGAPSATAQPGQKQTDQTLHFYIGEGNGSTGQAQPGATQSGATPSDATPSTTDAVPPASSGTSAVPTTPAPTVKQTVATATRAPAAKTPQARPAKKVNEFWIQTGSYKSQSKAEDLVAMLGGKGLTGRVFSTTANSDTFYRVRIGPYTSKSEAEKFLGIVKQLQGLEASFISMVPAKKNPVN
jgi:DedD protein